MTLSLKSTYLKMKEIYYCNNFLNEYNDVHAAASFKILFGLRSQAHMMD